VVASSAAIWDASLIERVRQIRLVVFDFDGVFTDNMVYVFEDGREAVRCFRGDGIGLRQLERLGIDMLMLSTEVNPVVAARSRKLRIRCIQNCEDKRAALESLGKEQGLSLRQIAFVGNDVNDLSCLQCVGLSIVVRDAHADVVPFAHYQTVARGGQGAVREVCDLFVRVLSEERK
jgi:YrbI family 3-deoxy-D-manno-octulosonate 8-phosphate phosphatase